MLECRYNLSPLRVPGVQDWKKIEFEKNKEAANRAITCLVTFVVGKCIVIHFLLLQAIYQSVIYVKNHLVIIFQP